MMSLPSELARAETDGVSTVAHAPKTVCAVVITYNRLEMLKECIASLRAQSRPPDRILVVNNGSTDESQAWLDQQDFQTILQGNFGGAGGFFTGMKEAAAQGHDWIWCMDDDVIADAGCLQALLSCAEEMTEPTVLCPLRFTPDSRPLGNEQIYLDFTHPLKDHGPVRLRSVLEAVLDGQARTKVEGFTFEGPLIPLEIIKQIGFPDRNFFIIADDTDYSARCRKHFSAFVVHGAIMHRKLQESSPLAITWKDYYYVRNTLTLLSLRYGTLWVKLFRPSIRAAAFLRNRFLQNKSRDWAGVWWVLRGLFDGYCGLDGRRH